MVNDQYHIHVGRALNDFGYDFVIGEYNHCSDKRTVMCAVEQKEVKPGEFIDPTMTLNSQQAQMLMDAMWNAGIRPSDQGSPGQIAAMKAHTDDLRKIAFKALKIEEK